MSEKDQKQPKTVKVAGIMTTTQIVLDKGASDGMLVGARYEVIHRVEIPSPDDETKVLSTITYVKGVVEVVSVHKGVSVARPPLTTLTTHSGSISGFGTGFPSTITKKIRPDLKVEGALLSSNDLIIRVGDTAVLTI